MSTIGQELVNRTITLQRQPKSFPFCDLICVGQFSTSIHSFTLPSSSSYSNSSYSFTHTCPAHDDVPFFSCKTNTHTTLNQGAGESPGEYNNKEEDNCSDSCTSGRTQEAGGGINLQAGEAYLAADRQAHFGTTRTTTRNYKRCCGRYYSEIR